MESNLNELYLELGKTSYQLEYHKAVISELTDKRNVLLQSIQKTINDTTD